MSSAPRAWVRLPSGRRLDLINPTPLDWDDEDLAMRLARTYRWGGESAWPLPLSVAQHALTVLAICRSFAADGPLSAHDALRELHHDSDEGLLGFDCLTPLKPLLGEPFRRVAERLQTAVFLRYQLRPWTVQEKKVHKRADRLAAASEAVHVVGWSPEEVRHTLKIAEAPLAVDPLVAVYGDAPWEPWPSQVAAERFLAEMKALARA